MRKLLNASCLIAYVSAAVACTDQGSTGASTPAEPGGNTRVGGSGGTPQGGTNSGGSSGAKAGGAGSSGAAGASAGVGGAAGGLGGTGGTTAGAAGNGGGAGVADDPDLPQAGAGGAQPWCTNPIICPDDGSGEPCCQTPDGPCSYIFTPGGVCGGGGDDFPPPDY
jgi:hypothetical protein